jgi:Nucleoside-diphosphate-sugar epimerases
MIEEEIPVSNVLITGGAGFIGAHVTRSLLELPELSGFQFTILDDLSGGFPENIPVDPRVELVVGSIADASLVSKLFAERKFEYVYHLAAYAAEGLSHFIRHFNYSNNLLGSVNLINNAVKENTKCFVFTSSIAVYGAAQVPMLESMTPRPEDPYGIAKYAVELDLRAAKEMFGLEHVIFRPHNVYGEFQNIGDRYRNVIGIFMNQVLQGQPMTVFGDGEQQRNFTYISEVAPIIAKSPFVKEARNQVFNIGADTPYTVNSLAEQVAAALNVTPHIKHLPARNEVTIAYSDHGLCYDVFGKSDAVTLHDGLKRMASWVRKVGARKSSSFENIEILRNLPPSWLT